MERDTKPIQDLLDYLKVYPLSPDMVDRVEKAQDAVNYINENHL